MVLSIPFVNVCVIENNPFPWTHRGGFTAGKLKIQTDQKRFPRIDPGFEDHSHELSDKYEGIPSKDKPLIKLQ